MQTAIDTSVYKLKEKYSNIERKMKDIEMPIYPTPY